MDLDFAGKLVVFGGALGLVYLLARHFSARGADQVIVPPPALTSPAAGEPLPFDPEEEEKHVRRRREGATTITNYGFRSTDLRAGPPDPSDFYDELHVSLFNHDTGHRWDDLYIVCTPRGLERYMREHGWQSLLVNGYIVVARYDVDLILHTILEPHESTHDEPPATLPPSSENSAL